LDICVLDSRSPRFPDTRQALREPNGLLALGGNLSSSTLLEAYRRGIFPWYSEGQPLLWWSPNPRMVIYPDEVHISKSLSKFQKKKPFSLSLDRAFREVIQACANSPRLDQDGTWISDEMMQAYIELHHQGHAHSIEVWRGEDLVGGLYGIAIGHCFFGESMFSHAANASKVAFVSLCQQFQRWQFPMIDCQVYSEHLASLGAREIDREPFEQSLAKAVNEPYFDWRDNWQLAEHGFE
jgi:leucyl/phenylalanyl-tRNA--protein transferase